MPDPVVITLGDLAAQLVAPRPFTAVSIGLTGDSPDDPTIVAHGAAALAAAWPESVVWPAGERPHWRVGIDVAAHGARVIDDLVGAGVDAQALVVACYQAFTFVCSGVRAVQEATREAADFSQPPEGATSSTSSTSASGEAGSPPTGTG